jgi:DNA mismatch repair protein MutL
MNRIRLLSPDVVEKIAAGEVIERPFSVVKELVENSLDAGATEIRIELEAGGKRLIRIQDNGTGMAREDAGLCFERHATSKISSETDLEQISTLGFRGEALASISAVAELILRTSDGSGGPGTQIERKGGVTVSVQDVAFPRGTSVEVKDLFFNLPARRKFLRSDRSELSLIVRYVSGVALAFPETRFFLAHGRREIIHCPAVGSLRERIYQLHGREAVERLMEVDFREGDRSVIGFGSRPPHGRPDKASQLFFVNNRPVKDRILQAALNQAYRGFLEKDLFPEAFIFLNLPLGEVDVNVHPAKAEVRFRDSQLVFYVVLRAVDDAVQRQRGIKEVYPSGGEDQKTAGVAEAPRTESLPYTLSGDHAVQRLLPGDEETGKHRTHPRVLGQYLDTYIIAAGEEGLLVIDQHNAHERVLFEKYREIEFRKKWPQRAPLIPVLFDLSPSQIVSLEKNQTLLDEAGFRLSSMGGRTYTLDAFPDIFSAEEAKETLMSLLEEMTGGETEKKREKILATLACRTAVKAKEPLPKEKMDFLVEELFRTSNPGVCPHGRPVIVRLDRNQIEKGLKRSSG